MILTKKQEDFAFNIAVKGMNNTDAYRESGYAVAKLADNTLWANASRLAADSKVRARVETLKAEIKEKLLSPLVATELERREILTSIFRDKAKNAVHAIDVHNKMDKIYEASPVGYQDNRVINIIVMDQKTKELMERVKDRTGKLIEEGDGD